MSKKISHNSNKFQPLHSLGNAYTHAMIALGDFGNRKNTDEAAYRAGQRRAIAVPLLVTLGLTGKAVLGSERTAPARTHQIENCAGLILGHTVHIGHDALGGQIIPPADYGAVQACEVSDGNVERAKERMEQAGPTGTSQP